MYVQAFLGLHNMRKKMSDRNIVTFSYSFESLTPDLTMKWPALKFGYGNYLNSFLWFPYANLGLN